MCRTVWPVVDRAKLSQNFPFYMKNIGKFPFTFAYIFQIIFGKFQFTFAFIFHVSCKTLKEKVWLRLQRASTETRNISSTSRTPPSMMRRGQCTEPQCIIHSRSLGCGLIRPSSVRSSSAPSCTVPQMCTVLILLVLVDRIRKHTEQGIRACCMKKRTVEQHPSIAISTQRAKERLWRGQFARER